nr:lipoprotein [Shewanella sp. HN-41]
MLRKMRLFLLLMLGSLFITACGQKGPLYKSPSVEASQATKAEAPKTVPEAEKINTEIKAIEVEKRQ